MVSAVVRSSPFASCDKRACAKSRCVRVHARHADQELVGATRRGVLLAGSAVLTTTLVLTDSAKAQDPAPGKSLLGVQNLNSFQRNAERAAFLKLVESELKKELRSEDAPDTLRLVLHDAGTYNVATETGGLNGSIRFSEELNRPENKSLLPLVDRLKKVKSVIDQKTTTAGYGSISWADLEVLAAKVANETSWRVIKTKGGLPSSGDVISSAFGAAWPVKLGRRDADKPDPANRLPLPEASVQEITEYFARLNNRSYGATGFFAPKPIFDQRQAFILWGSSQPNVEAAEAKLVADPNFKYKDWKTKYDRSRQTVTRTEYEVDFIDLFNQIASLGANFNKDAYLVPIEIDTPRL